MAKAIDEASLLSWSPRKILTDSWESMLSGYVTSTDG